MTHCFADVLQRLVELASKLFLHITEKTVVRGCQVVTVGRVREFHTEITQFSRRLHEQCEAVHYRVA